jgi:hypothetical protein
LAPIAGTGSLSDSEQEYPNKSKGTGVKEPAQLPACAAPGSPIPVQQIAQETDPNDLDEILAKPKQTPAAQGTVRQQANEFAIKYWRFLGARSWEEAKARNQWTGTFVPLIERHGLALVKDAVRWAKNHETLGKLLARYRGSDDSAEWLVENFEDILSRRATESERKTKKPQGSSSAQPQPTRPPMIRAENNLHF